MDTTTRSKREGGAWENETRRKRKNHFLRIIKVYSVIVRLRRLVWPVLLERWGWRRRRNF
jgi:hypothetical protein